MDRPRVTAFLGISLDGFVAGEGGDLSWLVEAGTDTAETGFDRLMASVDALVMGRNTYDAVERMGSWPYAGTRVVVLTHRPLDSPHAVDVLSGELPTVLARLHREGHRHVYLDGGATVRQGFAADAVDALTLTWLPIVLGRGIPLFGTEVPRRAWRLDATRPLRGGLVQASYVRTGAPTSSATCP